MEFRQTSTAKNIDDKQVQKICKQFALSPAVAKLLLMRGVDTEQKIEKFLHPNLQQLNDPYKFDQMHKVVERIQKAIAENQRVLIFGDYDVDGITSTYILFDYLT